MSTAFRRFLKRAKDIAMSGMLIVVVLTSSGAMLFPTAASAQLTSFDVGLNPLSLSDSVKAKAEAVKNTVLNQVVSNLSLVAFNQFMQETAYALAVSLTSDCPGQAVCFNTAPLGTAIANAGLHAAGEAINQLSKDTGFADATGFDICNPGVDFSLAIQLGAIAERTPPKPSCPILEIGADGKAHFGAAYENLYNNAKSLVEAKDAAQAFSKVFKAGGNPLDASLKFYNVVDAKLSQAQDIEKTNNLLSGGGTGGWKPVVDPVSQKVLVPAKEQELTSAQAKTEREGTTFYQNAISSINQRIANDKFEGVLWQSGFVFGQTVLSRLWNKATKAFFRLLQGSTDSNPDVVLSASGQVQTSGISGANRTQSEFLRTPKLETNTFDPFTDFVACPPTGKHQNNCVDDGTFASLIQQPKPLTIREAIQGGQLSGEKQLVSSLDAGNDKSPDCYRKFYCESNLKKLRADRIISIGWELAAHEGGVIDKANPPKLKDVVNAFNDCNANGIADDQHPYCHMIDPDWVIKLPPMECKALVYGPQLDDPASADRAQVCVDSPSCLQQDDYGSCTGGYGYCTKERNIWRFGGDQCPYYYNSCKIFTPTAGGNQVALLANTVDNASCTSDNVGCSAYSTQRTANGWDPNVSRYLNAKAQSCTADQDGCSGLTPLASDQSLNLVRNGGFETMDDGDASGVPTHALYWSPMGVVPAGGNGELSTDGTHAFSGKNAILLSSTSPNKQLCTLATACASQQGCTCTNGDGSTCRVDNGDTVCKSSQLVMQDLIPIQPNKTYTLSLAVKTATGAAFGQGIEADVAFENSSGANLAVQQSQLSLAPSGNSACIHGPAGAPMIFQAGASGISGAEAPGEFCSFSISTPGVAFLKLVLSNRGDGVSYYVDNVQLEEGQKTAFHESYGGANSKIVYAKMPPAYLGCTGEDSDPAACANYAHVCRENENGCNLYTPNDGDPGVPGIIGSQDRCPAECVGYAAFITQPSNFDSSNPVANFIPSTATQCTQADVGCSEFTNVATEAKSDFSQLRLCQKPTDPGSRVYYTWEGTDTVGYQLKQWNLKESDKDPVYAPITCSLSCTDPNGCICSVQGVGSCLVANNASSCSMQVDLALAGAAPEKSPCTRLSATDPTQCDDVTTFGASLPANFSTGYCTRADIDGGNDDCREFYDASGNRHYRLLSKTILATDDCQQYRITGTDSANAQADCNNSNGAWNDTRKECLYNATATESRSCSASVVNCRAYKGNASNNIKIVLSETFETYQSGDWGNSNKLQQSTNAIAAGGHSLRMIGVPAQKDITSSATPGRDYLLTFWSRGSGTLTVSFTGAATPATFVTGATLTGAWQQYSYGPVTVTDPNWGKNPVTLQFAPGSGNDDIYIDNVVLKQVQDNIYVVRDSWKTPASCDETTQGTPSPQEMLGCRAYTDTSGASVPLRSFTQLCREQSVGCSAYSDTRNNLSDPNPQTFNAVCSLPSACTSDSCQCNFHYRDPHSLSDANAESFVVENACEVKKGSSQCRFTLDGADIAGTAAAYPDRVSLPGGRKVYLVVNEKSQCDATAIGCTAMGVPNTVFDQKCQLPGGQACAQPGGCTCSLPSPATGTCTAAQGATDCTVLSNTGFVNSWTDTAFLDNPTTYGQTLCQASALRCAEYTAQGSTYYFRDPGNKICQFQENITINGQQLSGWFRKDSSGNMSPCAPSLLKNGTYADIAKNADASYSGWAGSCDPKFDRCEEFVDPMTKSSDHPNGQPYYYLMNDKVDTASCNGNGSLKQQCIMLDETSNLSHTFSAAATYYLSDTKLNGGLQPAINCDGPPGQRDASCESRCLNISNGVCKKSGKACESDAACGNGDMCLGNRTYGIACNQANGDKDCNVALGETCVSEAPTSSAPTFTGNDANIIIHATPDRECAEWLACTNRIPIWDGKSNKTICVKVAACDKAGAAGDGNECSDLVTEPASPTILTKDAYTSRDVTFRGVDYSGYSIPNEYPLQDVTSVTVGTSARYGVAVGPLGCDASNPDAPICPSNSTCVRQRCVDAGGNQVGPSTCDATNPNAPTCPANSACVNHRCLAELAADASGQRVAFNLDPGYTANQSACRGYPESDSPFPAIPIVLDWGAGQNPTPAQNHYFPKTVIQDFRGANICEHGNCECSYKKEVFGNTPTYFAPDADPSTIPPGICSGGARDGMSCDKTTSTPNDKDFATEPANPTHTCPDGSCELLKKTLTTLGWSGLCIDYDASTVLNADQGKPACNLWLPIDQLPGTADLYNQHNEAGYQGPTDHDLLYCQVAQGNEQKNSYEVWLDHFANKTAATEPTFYSYTNADKYVADGNSTDARFVVRRFSTTAGTCQDGPSRGLQCSTDSDCTEISQCKPTSRCAGGVNPGTVCTSSLACGGGFCQPSGSSCSGGASNGRACTGNNDCATVHRCRLGTTATNVITRDQIAGVEVQLLAGGTDSDPAGKDSAASVERTFWLLPSNNFTNGIEYHHAQQNPGGNALDLYTWTMPELGATLGLPGQSKELAGKGEQAECLHIWSKSGCGNSSEPYDPDCATKDPSNPPQDSCVGMGDSWGGCASADLEFSNQQLNTFRWHWCWNSSHGANNSSHIKSAVRTKIYFKECCNVLTKLWDQNVNFATDPNKTSATNSYLINSPWTDLLMRTQTSINGHPIDQTTVKFSSTAHLLSPYGAANGIQVDSTTGTLVDDKGQPTLAHVAVDIGGSQWFTPDHVACPDTNPSCTTSSPVVPNGETNTTAVGFPYSCTGPCRATMPNTSNLGAGAAGVGQDSLSKIFVRSLGNFTVNGQQYVPSAAWDARTTAVSSSNRPIVVPVDFSQCDASAHCAEGSTEGITVGKKMSGDIKAVGKISLNIDFFAYADKDHMPIRELIIDPYGGGNVDSPSWGAYKNRRGVIPIPNKPGTFASYCGSGDPAMTAQWGWGINPSACDTAYYDSQVNYTCNAALVNSRPVCDGTNYPCSSADGKCVYKPRVQILDNWLVCNGKCATNGTNGACMNVDTSSDAKHPCDAITGSVSAAPGDTPWTSYNGLVIVAP